MGTLPTMLLQLGLATLLLASGIAAQSSARPANSDLPGPIQPAEWKVLRPKAGDTIALMHAESNFLVEDTIVQASKRTALICYVHAGPYRGLVVRNSILMVEPGTLELDRSYWAVRAYDLIDARFERVAITGFGVVTPKHDEGHAIYVNLAGSLTLEDCDIHHNGGQGLQIVNRPAESSLPPGPAKGQITVKRTRFAENGFNPNRGAFQVSIFGTGQDILFEDVTIEAGHDETTWPKDKTGGALVIEAEGFRPRNGASNVWWRPLEVADDFKTPFTQGKVELVRLRVDHRAPNRPIVQIKGCRELIVRDSEFVSGRVELDLPNKPGRNCGTIEWQGNRGKADVFLRGRRIGRADEDFRIE